LKINFVALGIIHSPESSVNRHAVDMRLNPEPRESFPEGTPKALLPSELLGF
jgi:hypothetical protein